MKIHSILLSIVLATAAMSACSLREASPGLSAESADGRSNDERARDACADTLETGDGSPDAGAGAQIADASCVGKDLATDPTSCGICGRSCGGGRCSDGGCEPVEIASDQPSPLRIATDGVNVYWTDTSLRTIMKCAVGGCGGTPTAIVSPQLPGPTHLALGAGAIYWLNGSTASGGVMKCLLAGCASGPVMLAPTVEPAVGLATDGTTAIWGEWNPSSIRAVSLGGGAATTLHAATRPPKQIVMDATSIYWVEADRGIFRMKKDGTGSTTIDIGLVAAVAIDADHVYWTKHEDPPATPQSGVFRADKDGSNKVTLASGVPRPSPIAVDGKHV